MTSRSMMVAGALSFSRCKVMFHVMEEGTGLQDLQQHSWEADSWIRKREWGYWRDEIFRQSTAGAAPLLDLEQCVRVC